MPTSWVVGMLKPLSMVVEVWTGIATVESNLTQIMQIKNSYSMSTPGIYPKEVLLQTQKHIIMIYDGGDLTIWLSVTGRVDR